MNKKTIIIILLVVAALGFFAWKKGLFGGAKTLADAGGGDSGSFGSDADLDNTNSIIDNLDLDSDERKSLKRWARHITQAANSGNYGWSVANLKKSAETNGISLHQQIVLSAAYQMYATGKEITAERYHEIEDEIYDM